MFHSHRAAFVSYMLFIIFVSHHCYRHPLYVSSSQQHNLGSRYVKLNDSDWPKATQWVSCLRGDLNLGLYLFQHSNPYTTLQVRSYIIQRKELGGKTGIALLRSNRPVQVVWGVWGCGCDGLHPCLCCSAANAYNWAVFWPWWLALRTSHRLHASMHTPAWLTGSVEYVQCYFFVVAP